MPTWISDGPFDSKPTGEPARTASGYPQTWGQARDGKWYSFASNMGPTGSYKYEHPDDPNFWASLPGRDPVDYGPRTWACRHGYWAGDCKHGCPKSPCVVTVTDEEMEEAGRKVLDLLASMESK